MDNFNTPGRRRASGRGHGQRRLDRHHPQSQSPLPPVNAGWWADEPGEDFAKQMELVDFRKMNEIRARVDSIVKDPKTAEALKPWYRQFCKRPTFNDEYLPAFNRPNVTLVDTLGRGVDRITETGAGVRWGRVRGRLHHLRHRLRGRERPTPRRAGFEVYGRGGVSLSDNWAGGLKTLHGFYSHGFPNCFHLGVTQNALTVNFPTCSTSRCAMWPN